MWRGTSCIILITPPKRNQRRKISQNLRLTMYVMLWIMIHMHKSTYLSRNGYINSVLESMGMDAFGDRVPGNKGNGMNMLDKVSRLKIFRGHCTNFCCASYLLSEVFVSFYLPLFTLIGTLASMSDLSLCLCVGGGSLILHIFNFIYLLCVLCC